MNNGSSWSNGDSSQLGDRCFFVNDPSNPLGVSFDKGAYVVVLENVIKSPSLHSLNVVLLSDISNIISPKVSQRGKSEVKDPNSWKGVNRFMGSSTSLGA